MYQAQMLWRGQCIYPTQLCIQWTLDFPQQFQVMWTQLPRSFLPLYPPLQMRGAWGKEAALHHAQPPQYRSANVCYVCSCCITLDKYIQLSPRSLVWLSSTLTWCTLVRDSLQISKIIVKIRESFVRDRKPNQQHNWHIFWQKIVRDLSLLVLEEPRAQLHWYDTKNWSVEQYSQ